MILTQSKKTPNQKRISTGQFERHNLSLILQKQNFHWKPYFFFAKKNEKHNNTVQNNL